MRRGFFLPLSSLVFLAQFVTLAHAAWPHDPNVNLPVCTAVGFQENPSLVTDGAGGAIVVWQDSRDDTYDIYAQRVSATGEAQWAANGVAICVDSHQQVLPTITSDGAGGAIIVWEDWRDDCGDIYAQRVDATGVVQWAAGGVAICATRSWCELYPAIVSDGSGGAIIGWHDDHRDTYYDIRVQRVDAAGVVQWTAGGVAICTTSCYQSGPLMVSDGSGGAIVTWSDLRSGDFDLYTQRVDAAGVVQWTANGMALCTASYDQGTEGPVADGSGGVIVAWEDYRDGTNCDIYVQRVNAAGTIQWATDGVALCTASHDQGAPAVASDGSGGVIIAWEDYRDSTNRDIYVQRVNAAGTIQWTTDGVALCTASYDQRAPAVASDGSGGAIVMWLDYGYSGAHDLDIYGQRVTAVGTAAWATDGVAICTAAMTQFPPRTVADGCGGVIAMWQDFRSGDNYDIYAQQVGSDGQLGHSDVGIEELVVAGLSLSLGSANPARGGATLCWALPVEGEARLVVYDVTGRAVRELVTGRQPAGVHATGWDGRDAAGHAVAAGLYLARLEAMGRALSVRVVLVR